MTAPCDTCRGSGYIAVDFVDQPCPGCRAATDKYVKLRTALVSGPAGEPRLAIIPGLPDLISGLLAERDALVSRSPSYDALLIISQSVAAALERAGVEECDDPGDAIDVLAKDAARYRWLRKHAADVWYGDHLIELIDTGRGALDSAIDAEMAGRDES